MTTTAPDIATEEPTAPAEIQTDKNGTFVLVNGTRVPVNAPGVAVLDGTPGESAYNTLMALEKAITALDEQRTAAKDAIKAEMGDRAIATLHGEPVVDWTWGSQTTVNGALLKAMSRTLWNQCTRTSPRRPFNLKKNRQAA